ncbi:BRCT domain-containing protein, partial [Pyrus ussuriensis x Pyrus communis]
TMIGLMGAKFSKPLVANKVTHLVCYKFEGEKYELAKKIPKMKLVNHHWLEDCLRDWQLLPEDKYKTSGYELEMMEAEARDSEDEAENTFVKQAGVRSMYKSPHNIKAGSPTTPRLPIPEGEMPNVPLNKLDQASSVSNSYVSKGLSCQDACQLRAAGGGDLNDQHHGTPDPKVRDDFITNCGSAERASHSAGKLSYSRQTSWRPTLPLHMGYKSGRGSVSSKVPIRKLNANDDLASYTLNADQADEKFDSNCVEVPLKDTNLQNREESSGIFPQKRVMDLSYASSKSQKTNPGAKSGSMHSPSSSIRSPKVKPTSLIDGSCETTSHYIVAKDDYSLDKTGNLNAAGNSSALTFSAAAISNTGKDENTNTKSSPTTFRRLRKSSLSSKPGIADSAEEKTTTAVSKTVELQNQPQNVGGSSPSNENSVNNSSNDPASLNLLKERNNDLVTKHLKQKVKSKKTLGSWPKLVSASQKGSVHLYKDASLNDTKKSPDPTKLGVLCPDVNFEPPNEVEGKDVNMSADVAEKNSESMDDETEAPEEESEHKLENVLHEAKGMVAQATSKCVDSSGQEQHLQDHSDACAPRDVMAKSGSDNIYLLVESTANGNAVKGKKNQGKKRALGKTKLKTVPPVTDVVKPNKVVSEENTRNDNTGVTEKKQEKRRAGLVGKSKCRGVPQNKLENSSEMKENRPTVGGDQTVSKSKQQAEKSTAKSDITPLKIIQTSVERSNNPSTPEGKAPSKDKIEPVRFILSGHRFQRKEFQKVVKRLKGQCCWDSHHWSYQATHFISPDRVGRTEKFFAAVASGRWILKSDYLEASDKEGRFLEEEPYEWYKNGTINLEAPRKWRLLRERTGHGAFHGMRIIIYGECIAPPLDTLKRVMKAGDGTILATSPPYTRFLKSGVDYAIVSPGMPHADMWVQELLKHEIPCVVADYLVEYVCKPGHRLDRHVLYNTNAWAEKSFERVQSRAKDMVGEAFTGEDGDDSSCGGGSDIACVVCGCGERGEVMLICGNESGSVGCGIGTHIECCSPPLESIPEDDWFCPNCSWSKNSTKSSKKRKKGLLVDS